MIPLALAAGLACMHGAAKKTSTVSEADVGRLGPEQQGPVNEARRKLDVASDALSRTSLKLEQARNEQGTAKADLEAAKAAQKVADAMQKVANDSRAPDALEKASRLQERAKAHGQAAGLHVAYAGKLLEQREAEVQAAERQVEAARARVEWSRLQALEQAGNPAATKYDAGRFQTAVNDAQREAEGAAQHARSLEGQATEARQRWESSRQRLEALGSSPAETGTATGE